MSIDEETYNSLDWQEMKTRDVAAAMTGCTVLGVETCGAPLVPEAVTIYLQDATGQLMALEIGDHDVYGVYINRAALPATAGRASA